VHIHVGLIEFLVVGAYVTIWNFLMRALAAQLHTNTAGKALSTLV
jgi:hypothetical protein